ncbi:hypothetical protein CR513_31493, partial [Mucuna pruriens]
MRKSIRETKERGGMKKIHVEKGGRRRILGGEKKSLVKRGEREDMRNPTKNEEGGTLSHLTEKKWRASSGRSQADLKHEMRSRFVPASFARTCTISCNVCIKGPKA